MATSIAVSSESPREHPLELCSDLASKSEAVLDKGRAHRRISHRSKPELDQQQLPLGIGSESGDESVTETASDSLVARQRINLPSSVEPGTDRLVHDGEDQIVLPAEVEVDRAFAEAGRSDDLLR